GNQQRARDRGSEAAAPERVRDAEAQRHVCEQVEGRSATKSNRFDRAELVAQLRERGLHREREQDDADDHRQVEVRVDVTCDRDALLAASVGEQLTPANLEEDEVREPERRLDEQPEQRRSDHACIEPRAPRAGPMATSDSPIAMITINPCRSTKCAGSTRQPRTPTKAGPKKPTASAVTHNAARRPSSVNPAARISSE